jgi:hypothetical protein
MLSRTNVIQTHEVGKYEEKIRNYWLEMARNEESKRTIFNDAVDEYLMGRRCRK